MIRNFSDFYVRRKTVFIMISRISSGRDCPWETFNSVTLCVGLWRTKCKVEEDVIHVLCGMWLWKLVWHGGIWEYGVLVEQSISSWGGRGGLVILCVRRSTVCCLTLNKCHLAISWNVTIVQAISNGNPAFNTELWYSLRFCWTEETKTQLEVISNTWFVGWWVGLLVGYQYYKQCRLWMLLGGSEQGQQGYFHTHGALQTPFIPWRTCWHELSGAQSFLWVRAWREPVPNMYLLMYQVTIVTQVLKSKTPLESRGLFDVETREAKPIASKLGRFPGRKNKGSNSLFTKDPDTVNISNLCNGLLKLSEVKTYCIFAPWKTFYGCLFPKRYECGWGKGSPSGSDSFSTWESPITPKHLLHFWKHWSLSWLSCRKLNHFYVYNRSDFFFQLFFFNRSSQNLR